MQCFCKTETCQKGVRWKRAHGDRELWQCRGPGRGSLLSISPRAQARKGSKETVMNEVPEQAGARRRRRCVRMYSECKRQDPQSSSQGWILGVRMEALRLIHPASQRPIPDAR